MLTLSTRAPMPYFQIGWDLYRKDVESRAVTEFERKARSNPMIFYIICHRGAEFTIFTVSYISPRENGLKGIADRLG